MEQLLPGSNQTSSELSGRLEEKGAKIFVKSRVASITKAGEVATVEVDTPEGRIKLEEADKVLQSVGRQARVEKMNLSSAGCANRAKKGT